MFIPFLPRQLTIVSSLTIGIPAFVLALAPTNQRYRAGFLARVLRLSVPAGVIVVVGVLCARLTLILMGSNRNQISSVCTLVLVAGGTVAAVFDGAPLGVVASLASGPNEHSCFSCGAAGAATQLL